MNGLLEYGLIAEYLKVGRADNYAPEADAVKVDTEAAHGGEDRDHADSHAAPADAEDGEIARGGEDRELDDPRALEVEAGADNELAHRGEVCEQGGPHALEVEAEVDERVQVGEHVEQKVVLLHYALLLGHLAGPSLQRCHHVGE